MKIVVQKGEPWPFRDMRIGDVAYCLNLKATAVAHAYGSRLGMRFTTRRVKSKSGQVGVRVERVPPRINPFKRVPTDPEFE